MGHTIQKKIYIVALLSVFFVSCSSGNLFTPFAVTTDDDSLFVDAQQKMNAKDWTGAIKDFSLMSSAYVALSDKKIVYASAYAGRCGLDLINFANSLQSLGSGSSLLATLLKTYAGTNKSSQAGDCQQAVTLIQSLGINETVRTPAQNLLMAFVELTLMGTILAEYADVGGTGKADTTFDPCFVANQTGVTALPFAEAQNFFAALMNAIGSLVAAGNSSLSKSVSGINTLCSTIQGLPGGAGVCGNRLPTDFTTTTIGVLVGILKTTDLGVGTGSCTSSTYATNCICTSGALPKYPLP